MSGIDFAITQKAETCSAFVFFEFNLLGRCTFKLFSIPFLYLSMTFVSTLYGMRILIISLAFDLTQVQVNFFLLDLSGFPAIRLSVGVMQK